MRKKIKKIPKITKITVIFAITLFFISVGYSFFEQTLSLVGKVYLVLPEETQEEEARINDVIINTWGTGGNIVYQFSLINITYMGQDPTYGWELIFQVPSDSVLNACWSAVCRIEGNRLIVTNIVANDRLQPGESFNIGFQFTSSLAGYQLNLASSRFFTASRPNPAEVRINMSGTLATSSGPWGAGPGRHSGTWTVRFTNNSPYTLFTWELIVNRTPDMNNFNFWGDGNWILRDDSIVFTPHSHQLPVPPNTTRTIFLMVEKNTTTNFNVISLVGKTLP